MYSGDEFYDDDMTSGPIEAPRRKNWEHAGKLPLNVDHKAEPAKLAPWTVCRRCGRPIRRAAWPPIPTTGSVAPEKERRCDE